MKRYDLRELNADFMPRMIELMNNDVKDGENGIFLFEIGDFATVQATADMVKENNWTLMNSLKFNEVDWTIVVKKEQPEIEVEPSTETEESK
ncbi:MAG: NADH-ubiquinone oxidoreductase subunit E family protein [Campylobacterota bacterium]|nr:NADH-ubiquinone oxidoreductase subunit E family protein [Campylobacterota bacterium]